MQDIRWQQRFFNYPVSPVPTYECDLSILEQSDNLELLAHVERVGVVFYRKEDQP